MLTKKQVMDLTQGAALIVITALLTGGTVVGQGAAGAQLTELASLADKVRDPDTRTRVAAFHRAWTIALSSQDSEVKLRALELMSEPAGSASDHIRMPAVYAVAEVANSASDQRVKLKALATLREPLHATQLPIRIAAIDAVNSIVCAGGNSDLVSAALSLLAEPIRSTNNGVRIPAINAVVRVVEHAGSAHNYHEALDLLVAPLNSMAAIGGMEVRMMAVVAVERIGLQAPEMASKSKAMGLLETYANKENWEPEARRRAREASTRVQNSITQR